MRSRSRLERSHVRNLRSPKSDGKRKIRAASHRASLKAKKMADLTIHPESASVRLAAVAAHPLSELLECPQESGKLLTGSSRSIDFDAGEVVFRQHGSCRGLYVAVSGDFVRKAERFQMRVTLGPTRPGDLVELAAALGDGLHTYTLTAVTRASMLLLPMEELRHAFESYPPLRMRLLEELAREVSRAYITCCISRVMPARRQSHTATRAEASSSN